MEKKTKIIVVTTLGLVFIVSTVFSFYLFSNKNPVNNIFAANSSTSNLKLNTNEKLLGSNELGKVTVEGPYGNINSPTKIAIITGVHPLESNSHKAIYETIKSNDKSLNYCYYIYKINVTKDAADYDKGRMNGQLLANQFVVPNIISQNYALAIDIHSNRGNEKEIRFVFAPSEDQNSKVFANKILKKFSDLVYYNPKSQTSPKYVTIPLIKAGIPSIVYETYLYDPFETTKGYAKNFIYAVDNIKFNN